MTEDESIFLDKIKLSFIVLEKESCLIETYADLLKDINLGGVNIEKIKNWDSYNGSWNFAHELYLFLKYNKVEEIKTKKKQDKIIEKEINELKEIMNRYENPKKEVNFDDLQKVVPIIQKIVSKSGYHDDKYKDDVTDEKPQFW